MRDHINEATEVDLSQNQAESQGLLQLLRTKVTLVREKLPETNDDGLLLPPHTTDSRPRAVDAYRRKYRYLSQPYPVDRGKAELL